jgi:propane monooxygenase coupling protein
MSEEQGQEQQGQEEFDRSSSNMVGVTFSQSVEGNIIADLMEQKEGVEVTHFPAMIRVDAENRLDFDLNEIQEAIGDVDEYTAYDFQIEMATHYGRMVADDDKVVLYANPEDAAEELGFDLLEQEADEPTEEAEQKAQEV